MKALVKKHCGTVIVLVGTLNLQHAVAQPVMVTPEAAGPTASASSPASAVPPGQFSGLPPLPPATLLTGEAWRSRPAAIPLSLETGTGRLLRLARPVAAVMAADPRVARVHPASADSLFIMATGPGHTTVVATAEDGSPVGEYDVTVRPARATQPDAQREGASTTAEMAAKAAAAQASIRREIRDSAAVSVRPLRDALIVSGTLSAAADAERAVSIARAHLGGRAPQVVNDIALLASIQVNLRVRVAEISRQVTRDLGFDWQAIANTGSAGFNLGLNTLAGGAAGAALGATSQISSSLKSSRFDINSVVDALATDQLITVLAEPNLTAQSGQTASFLAGGEFPVPVSANTTGQITIEFKQFGVSLAFVPTVLASDRLNLRVRPEVSELSDNGAIEMPIAGGTVRVPSLTVRRAETTVELGSGQSFAIAGLLQKGTTQIDRGVAGIADVPVLGALFRSDRFKRNETELVIIVTPYLVRPAASPAALGAPTDGFRPAMDLDRVLRQRQIARGAPPGPPLPPVDAGFILD